MDGAGITNEYAADGDDRRRLIPPADRKLIGQFEECVDFLPGLNK